MLRGVLVLDDEPGIRTLARFALEEGGFQVFLAASRPEAEQLCQAHSGDIHAGIFDVEVPGMTRADLGSLIEEWFRRKGIVFMSGYLADALEDLPAATVASAEFLKKPFLPRDLPQAVERALARVGPPNLAAGQNSS